MQFLYPQFLWALAALSIPIIIHLFNFKRYKRIFFTNVRFLQHIEQEHRSRNKLRNLLLLLARLLALACIIIAFAYPFLPRQEASLSPGKKYISIYVDNSFSMSNEGPEGELLEMAKRQAEAIAKQYDEGDAFQLLTNDFALKNQRWLSRQEFIQALQEVSIRPFSRDLPSVFARMKENFRKAETANKLAYFISDFQESMVPDEEVLEAEGIQLAMLPMKAAVESNIYIDSVWFDNPVFQVGYVNTLKAKILNSSPETVENGTATLVVNELQKAIANYTIAANSSEEIELTFTVTDPGQNEGVLAINDYPITFDNELLFTFDVKDVIPVMIVNGAEENIFLNKAFAAEPAFKVTNIKLGNLDYSGLNKYSFIILNEVEEISTGLADAVSDVLSAGNNVLVVPPAQDMEQGSYNSFLSQVEAYRVGGMRSQEIGLQNIDVKKPFFTQIFDEVPRNMAMPSATKYYDLQKTSSSRGTELLQLVNGDPFLSVSPNGAGNIYIAAVPFNEDWSNYVNNSLFLPVLYKMALYKNTSEKLYFVIGQDNYIQAPSVTEDKERIVKLVKDSLEMIPPQRVVHNRLNLFVEELIPEAGFYSVKASEKDRPVVYAFNYNRHESEMRFLSGEALVNIFGEEIVQVVDVNEASVSQQIRAVDEGTQLWKWFVAAAILFLLTETLLTRFWK